jgi:hypothetical protein
MINNNGNSNDIPYRESVFLQWGNWGLQSPVLCLGLSDQLRSELEHLLSPNSKLSAAPSWRWEMVDYHTGKSEQPSRTKEPDGLLRIEPSALLSWREAWRLGAHPSPSLFSRLVWTGVWKAGAKRHCLCASWAGLTHGALSFPTLVMLASELARGFLPIICSGLEFLNWKSYSFWTFPDFWALESVPLRGITFVSFAEWQCLGMMCGCPSTRDAEQLLQGCPTSTPGPCLLGEHLRRDPRGWGEAGLLWKGQ